MNKKTCFVYAMDCEGKKLDELLKDKYGIPETKYLITNMENIFLVDDSKIINEPSKNTGERFVRNYFKVDDETLARVFTLKKYGDFYTLKSQESNDNAIRVSFILKYLMLDKVVNIGVSGALKEHLRIGDVICSTQTLYQDGKGNFYTSEPRNPSISFQNSFMGPTLTISHFCEPEQKKILEKQTNAYCVDQESSLLGSLINGNIEVYRVISDELGHDINYFIKNIDESIKYLNMVNEEIIKQS